MAGTSTFATFVHFALVLLYFYTLHNYQLMTDRMQPYRPHSYGGNSKFLTFWCLLLQLAYFFWCCVTDLISASANNSSVGKAAVAVRDWFLAAIVFPIGTIVVTTFWSIYSIDRELIFPQALDKFFPSWLNHALHTYVVPLLLIDMMLVNHKYPSRRAGMAGTLMFGLSYLVWVLFLGFVKDIWVYPFFKVLHGIYFPLFFGIMSVVLVMFYIIGEKINGVLGGSKKEVGTEKID